MRHAVTAGGVTYRLRPMFLLGARAAGSARRTGRPPVSTSSGATPSAQSVDWSAPSSPTGARRPCSAAARAGAGLTLARFAGTGLARDQAAAIAAPDALGAATSGLFVRDTAYAATGVPFFGAPGYAGGQVSGPVWLDRAGLMESSWEASDLDGPSSAGRLRVDGGDRVR